MHGIGKTSLRLLPRIREIGQLVMCGNDNNNDDDHDLSTFSTGEELYLLCDSTPFEFIPFDLG